MKKITMILVLVCLCILCGCSHSSIDPYESTCDQGYEDGYSDGFEDGYEENDYSEDVQEFQQYIVNLMYDGKYDTVKDLQEEYPEAVGTALKKEFGTTDMDIITDYLQNGSKTAKDNCEICGKSVYADESVILPDGIDCAHAECVGSNNNAPPKVNK